jgi:fumarylacetoacetase
MTLPDQTHAADAVSWVPGATGHPQFPPQNLPLGIFSTAACEPRGGIAIGAHVFDVEAALADGLFSGLAADAAAQLREPVLNGFFALPPSARTALRQRVFALLTDASHASKTGKFLHPAEECVLHLPARIGDYTDFYTGLNHAENVGRLFRPDNPLLPNYKHVPIGYHGRSSSIRISGAPIPRPIGQLKQPDAQTPHVAPTQRLDYEVELGFWIGEGNPSGRPIAIGEARRHLSGICLLNDWSARDVQAWEYQPLGPFLAKNFATTISPWVVTSDALSPFHAPAFSRPDGDPDPLPYLDDGEDRQSGALRLFLECHIRTLRMKQSGIPATRVSSVRADQAMYWTPAQLIAHHTMNGCPLMPGDLLGSGTLSGSDPQSLGSLLELTRGGAAPITLENGEQRRFLEDGDEVTLTATARARGFATIGLGRCAGIVKGALG